MYRIKRQNYDLKVTPNHRMVIKKVNHKSLNGKCPNGFKNKYSICKADSLPYTFRVPIAGFWLGKNETVFDVGKFDDQNYSVQLNGVIPTKIPEKIPMSDFLKLLGWYISEGNLRETSKVGRAVHISSTKGKNPYYNEVDDLLHRIGLRHSHPHGTRNGFEIPSIALHQIFSECGRGAKNKRIPQWALSLDSSLLEDLFWALMKGDGSLNTEFRYYTVSPSLARDFIELCTKIGRTAWIENIKKSSSIKGKIIKSSLCYRINITKKGRKGLLKEANITRPFVKKEHYSGIVWCLEVEGEHNFLVERNGKFTFCGNSMIAEAFKSCKTIERSTAVPRYRLDCSQCEFKGEICSALKQPIAHRFFESMVRFAQARAWLYGRKEVDYADIEFALPYTIAHRVGLKDDVAAGFPSTFEWAKQDVIRNLDIKKNIWADALKAFLSILNNKNVTKNYKTLETLSERDLVIRQLMSWADEGLEDNLVKAKQEIKKFKKKGDLLSLEALTNELDNMPIPSHGKWELKKEIENIMEQNTVQKACTKEEMDEIMPKLLQNNFITPDDYNNYIENGRVTVKTSTFLLDIVLESDDEAGVQIITFKPSVMKTVKKIIGGEING